MDYQVQLDSFRGPLDLLLYLVKRNEVDIRDIPIARIAEQFLDYLRVLEIVDVEHAGDFLVMAATLMEIKSKMLLPRAELDADDASDPRLELVRQLIEYKKFKDAASLLETRAEQASSRMARVPAEKVQPVDPAQQPLASVELWDLVSAFGRLMRETLALAPKQIIVDETPIHVHMETILARLEQDDRVGLRDLFTPPYSKSRLVGLFLAMLELIKGKRIIIEQPDPFEDIWIAKAPPLEHPTTNGTHQEEPRA